VPLDPHYFLGFMKREQQIRLFCSGNQVVTRCVTKNLVSSSHFLTYVKIQPMKVNGVHHLQIVPHFPNWILSTLGW